MHWTIEEEAAQLERFLRRENIEINHNYVRMEKGYRPIFHAIVAFSWQLRHLLLDTYFLVFTSSQVILLTQNEQHEFTRENLEAIDHEAIHQFSFTRRYGYYCVSFVYQQEAVYFYLSDWWSSKLIDKAIKKLTGSVKIRYPRKNLRYLRECRFMGLLEDENYE